jgi:hypothetical protein
MPTAPPPARLTLWSPLLPAACADRLRAGWDGLPPGAGFESGAPLARYQTRAEVSGLEFLLRRGSFALPVSRPDLHGSLRAADGGTLIEAELVQGRAARGLWLGSAGLLLALYGSLAALALLLPAIQSEVLPIIATFPILLLVGFAGRRAGRELVRQDAELLVESLRETLEATDVAANPLTGDSFEHA